jgi:hypothetical protein
MWMREAMKKERGRRVVMDMVRGGFKGVRTPCCPVRTHLETTRQSEEKENLKRRTEQLSQIRGRGC